MALQYKQSTVGGNMSSLAVPTAPKQRDTRVAAQRIPMEAPGILEYLPKLVEEGTKAYVAYQEQKVDQAKREALDASNKEDIDATKETIALSIATSTDKGYAKLQASQTTKAQTATSLASYTTRKQAIEDNDDYTNEQKDELLAYNHKLFFSKYQKAVEAQYGEHVANKTKIEEGHIRSSVSSWVKNMGTTSFIDVSNVKGNGAELEVFHGITAAGKIKNTVLVGSFIEAIQANPDKAPAAYESFVEYYKMKEAAGTVTAVDQKALADGKSFLTRLEKAATKEAQRKQREQRAEGVAEVKALKPALSTGDIVYKVPGKNSGYVNQFTNSEGKQLPSHLMSLQQVMGKSSQDPQALEKKWDEIVPPARKALASFDDFPMGAQTLIAAKLSTGELKADSSFIKNLNKLDPTDPDIDTKIADMARGLSRYGVTSPEDDLKLAVLYKMSKQFQGTPVAEGDRQEGVKLTAGENFAADLYTAYEKGDIPMVRASLIKSGKTPAEVDRMVKDQILTLFAKSGIQTITDSSGNINHDVGRFIVLAGQVAGDFDADVSSEVSAVIKKVYKNLKDEATVVITTNVQNNLAEGNYEAIERQYQINTPIVKKALKDAWSAQFTQALQSTGEEYGEALAQIEEGLGSLDINIVKAIMSDNQRNVLDIMLHMPKTEQGEIEAKALIQQVNNGEGLATDSHVLSIEGVADKIAKLHPNERKRIITGLKIDLRLGKPIDLSAIGDDKDARTLDGRTISHSLSKEYTTAGEVNSFLHVLAKAGGFEEIGDDWYVTEIAGTVYAWDEDRNVQISKPYKELQAAQKAEMNDQYRAQLWSKAHGGDYSASDMLKAPVMSRVLMFANSLFSDDENPHSRDNREETENK